MKGYHHHVLRNCLRGSFHPTSSHEYMYIPFMTYMYLRMFSVSISFWYKNKLWKPFYFSNVSAVCNERAYSCSRVSVSVFHRIGYICLYFWPKVFKLEIMMRHIISHFLCIYHWNGKRYKNVYENNYLICFKMKKAHTRIILSMYFKRQR